VLTFQMGDPDRPRGHALVFFRDSDSPNDVWATYLVVAPIKMDLGKYIPAAFATQLSSQLTGAAPSAYPLPPVPEKFEGGLAGLERLAELRKDDLLDGGTLRMSDPLYALQPVTDIGAQYAEVCNSYLASQPLDSPDIGGERIGAGSSELDVDELLMQVMPDREKIGRLARLAGTLRYATEGGDQRLVDDTVGEMERVARHLGEKYRPDELVAAARSSAELAQLFIERCYKLVDEDYAALADIDRRIAALRAS
jgi:hypothetical protein